MKLQAGRCLTLEEGYKLNKLNSYTSYDVSIDDRAAMEGQTPMRYLLILQTKAARGDREAQAILRRYHICPRENSYV